MLTIHAQNAAALWQKLFSLSLKLKPISGQPIWRTTREDNLVESVKTGPVIRMEW